MARPPPIGGRAANEETTMSDNTRAKYAINLRDGTLVYRSEATDELTALYRWIPNDVANAIFKGTIKGMDVVNGIGKTILASADFDWNKYQEDVRKLNMRQQKLEVSEERANDLPPDNPKDSISLDELGVASPDAPAAPGGSKGGKSNRGGKNRGAASASEAAPAPAAPAADAPAAPAAAPAPETPPPAAPAPAASAADAAPAQGGDNGAESIDA